MKLFTRFCIIVLCIFAASQASAQNNVIQLRNATSSTTLISGTGGTYTLTFPSSTGTNGQALTTNGSGNLSWTTPASSIDALTDGVSNATSNTLILGLEPAGLTVNALRNTSVGLGALTAIDQGDENTILGFSAGLALTSGSTNTLIGTSAGSGLVTGAGNVMIGYQAGAAETGSNKLYIDNSSTSTPLIGGDFNTNALTFNGSVTTTGNTFYSTPAATAVTATGTSGGSATILTASFTSTWQEYNVTAPATASTPGFVRLPAGTAGQVVYLKLNFTAASSNTVTVVNADASNTNTVIVYDGVGSDVIVAHMMYVSSSEGWVLWSAVEYDK